MQISHAEARQLIQQSADARLPGDDEGALAVHLQTCPECSAYKNEIKNVEDALRSTMNRHWNLIPASLDMDAITGKVGFSPQGRLGFQLAMISLMILLAVFGAWRLVNINIIPTKITPPQVSPIPTPSTQMTNTRALAPNCEEIIYTVQQGDTLNGIASLFSTTAEAIADFNHLQPDMLKIGAKIVIPACFTPSATNRPATLTVTFSPAPLTASSP